MGQLSKVAKATGMVYDKTGVIYGTYRQYSFCVEETANAGIFSVHFWAAPADPQLAQGLYPYLEQLKQSRKFIRHVAAEGSHILVQMKIYSGTDKNRQNIEDVLNAVTGFLGQNSYGNVCNRCGKAEDLSLCQINGACMQLCGDCYHGAVNALSAEEQKAKLKKGNLVTGLVGYLVYKIGRVKRPQVGAAIGTTAGNAAATPEAVAAADPALAVVAAAATVQISAAIIVTAILCPLLVTFLDRVERKNHPERYVDDNREKAAIDGEMV